jgi:hypothetical protein
LCLEPSPVLLRSEEEKRSEHPEDHVREETECREIDVELSVVGADGKDLEDREDADAENVDGAHVEIVPLIDLAKLPDLLRVEIFLARAVPQHVLDVKWIAVGRFKDLSSVELGIYGVKRIVLEEVVDELDGNTLRQWLQFDLGEGCPDALKEEILFHLHDGSADEGDVQ